MIKAHIAAATESTAAKAMMISVVSAVSGLSAPDAAGTVEASAASAALHSAGRENAEKTTSITITIKMINAFFIAPFLTYIFGNLQTNVKYMLNSC